MKLLNSILDRIEVRDRVRYGLPPEVDPSGNFGRGIAQSLRSLRIYYIKVVAIGAAAALVAAILMFWLITALFQHLGV